MHSFEKMPKKWTLEKFFPRFGVLVLKSSSLLTDLLLTVFPFPQNPRAARTPCNYYSNASQKVSFLNKIVGTLVRFWFFFIQGVLASRGFLGERKNREKQNPRVTRSFLVLKPQNGGKTFPKSTFWPVCEPKTRNYFIMIWVHLAISHGGYKILN